MKVAVPAPVLVRILNVLGSPFATPTPIVVPAAEIVLVNATEALRPTEIDASLVPTEVALATEVTAGSVTARVTPSRSNNPLPTAPLAAIVTVPPVAEAPPEKVFAMARMSVPFPLFVNVVPVMLLPLRVVSEFPTTATEPEVTGEEIAIVPSLIVTLSLAEKVVGVLPSSQASGAVHSPLPPGQTRFLAAPPVTVPNMEKLSVPALPMPIRPATPLKETRRQVMRVPPVAPVRAMGLAGVNVLAADVRVEVMLNVPPTLVNVIPSVL